MDCREEFDRVLEGMEWEEVRSTLTAAIYDLLGDTPIPSFPSPPPPLSPSPPPPTPPVPAGIYTQPQPVHSLGQGFGGCYPPGAALQRYEQPGLLMAAQGLPTGQASVMYQGALHAYNLMLSGHHYSQAGYYSQGQNLPYQWPVNSPRAAAASHPAAPPDPFSSVPAVRLPGSLNQRLVPVGFLNGDVLYELVEDVSPPPAPAAPPPNSSMSRPKKRKNQQADDRPYVKKPLNAFMLFRKEQRPKVVAELNINNSATINTILGQRWKLLSKEEQAKYFEEARKERLLHEQQYPHWSAMDNYGRKRKRQRANASRTSADVSACTSGEVTQQAQKCVTPELQAVMKSSTSLTDTLEPSTSPADVMELSTCQTDLVEPSTSQAGVMEPLTYQTTVNEPSASQTVLMQPQITENLLMSELYDLLEEYENYWKDPPTAVSTAQVTPASPTEMRTGFDFLSID